MYLYMVGIMPATSVQVVVYQTCRYICTIYIYVCIDKLNIS